MPAPYRRPSRSKDRPMWARDLEHQTVSLWETARRQHLTHAEILDRYRTEIQESTRYSQLSNEQRACVFATFLACSEITSRRDLEWRLGPASGPLPGPHVWGEGSTLSTLAREPGALYGAHFWSGTDKPFSEYKPTNA